MMPVFEQPMRKLLGTLSPTISWLNEKGCVDVASVPESHLEAIKQLERIGVVHKRNNRSYELQKIRLRKLLGTDTIEELTEQAAQMAPKWLNLLPCLKKWLSLSPLPLLLVLLLAVFRQSLN
jgi:hypothetical protein